MNWLIFTLSAATFNALMDFFIKLSAGKIHEGLGGVVVNIAAVIPVALFTIWANVSGETISVTRQGTFYAVLAGLAIGIATVFMFKMFSIGTNISLGIPIMRTGVIIIASLLGIIFLKEGITFRYLIGFLLALLGLYLVITARA